LGKNKDPQKVREKWPWIGREQQVFSLQSKVEYGDPKAIEQLLRNTVQNIGKGSGYHERFDLFLQDMEQIVSDLKGYHQALTMPVEELRMLVGEIERAVLQWEEEGIEIAGKDAREELLDDFFPLQIKEKEIDHYFKGERRTLLEKYCRMRTDIVKGNFSQTY